MPLKSDNNDVDIVKNLYDVHIPSSPYNLIPPQVLIRQMREQKFHVTYSEYDDTGYILKYEAPCSDENRAYSTLPIPIGTHQLFTLRNPPSYTDFMTKASHYLAEFKNFVGATHII